MQLGQARSRAVARHRSRSLELTDRKRCRRLLKAAKRLEPLDPTLARETYLDALGGCDVAGQAGAKVLPEDLRAAPAALGPQPRLGA